MKYESQICTTREQSERLLKLGLKRDTADMGIVKSTNEIYVDCPTDYSFEKGLHIPAWSLHRLIELSGMGIIETTTDNIYDKVIQYIAYVIKCESFNKEYLNQ